MGNEENPNPGGEGTVDLEALPPEAKAIVEKAQKSAQGASKEAKNYRLKLRAYEGAVRTKLGLEDDAEVTAEMIAEFEAKPKPPVAADDKGKAKSADIIALEAKIEKLEKANKTAEDDKKALANLRRDEARDNTLLSLCSQLGVEDTDAALDILRPKISYDEAGKMILSAKDKATGEVTKDVPNLEQVKRVLPVGLLPSKGLPGSGGRPPAGGNATPSLVTEVVGSQAAYEKARKDGKIRGLQV